MAAHTPGPWKVTGRFGTKIAVGKNWNDVATVVRDGVTNYEANARLISASPELFDALRELVTLADKYNPGVIALSMAIQKADAAIEKAVGHEYETKTYSDGTTATGVAPLPDLSPRQQRASFAGELLDAVEVMMRGKTGPSIQLRGYLVELEQRIDKLLMAAQTFLSLYEENDDDEWSREFQELAEAFRAAVAKAKGER